LLQIPSIAANLVGWCSATAKVGAEGHHPDSEEMNDRETLLQSH
jgi:hypothetical protein